MITDGDIEPVPMDKLIESLTIIRKNQLLVIPDNEEFVKITTIAIQCMINEGMEYHFSLDCKEIPLTAKWSLELQLEIEARNGVDLSMEVVNVVVSEIKESMKEKGINNISYIKFENHNPDVTEDLSPSGVVKVIIGYN